MPIETLNFDVEQVGELIFEVQVFSIDLLNEVFMTMGSEFEVNTCFEVLHKGDITNALPVRELVV